MNNSNAELSMNLHWERRHPAGSTLGALHGLAGNMPALPAVWSQLMRNSTSKLSMNCIGLLLLACSVSAADRVVLVAGGGNNTNENVPLPPTEARLGSPFGVAFDRAGNLYLVEMT